VHNKLHRLPGILPAAFLFLLLTGCGVHKPFVPMDGAVIAKPATIAIIGGDTSEPTQHLAEFLSQELSRRTTFRVMPQEEISRRLAKYPVNLALADAFEQDKPVWVVPEEKTKLDAMQESLKSDYLFVIWGYGLSRETAGFGNNTTYSITALGNLYRYPNGRPVAFTYDQNDRGMSFLGVFKGEAYDIEKLLRDSAERIAEKFATATNTGR